MKKCVFFDRDGIVNKIPDEIYVKRWEDFQLLPEFVEVLRMVRGMGYEAVIVTNQGVVARGVISMEAVDALHENLATVLSTTYGSDLLDILCCPHVEGECECRKPRPGMLIEAAARHDIDLKSSWMVGDQERDIEAGRRAGCRTILVTPGELETKADFRVGDMKNLKSLMADVL